MKFSIGLSFLVVLAAAPAALAETIRVPSPGIPTIQAAVDYAWPGDVILVSPGEYADPVSLLSLADLEIRGAGKVVMVAGANVSMNMSSDIVLKGLEFAGATVSVSKSDDVHLVGLRFRDAASTALTISLADRARVSGCQFRSGGGIECEDAHDLVVERCRFEDITGTAVAIVPSLPGSDRVRISRNRILRAEAGIECNGEDLVVEDNRMAGLTEPGIDASLGSGNPRAILRRNRIQTTHDIAIRADGADSVVEKNTLVGGGIFLSNQGCLVRGNRVTAGLNAGIETLGPAHLERNQIRGGLMGIGVTGDGTTLAGNTVTGTVGPGIMVGAQDCRLSKNRVTGSGGVGIGIAGTGHLVTENRVSGSALPDLADEQAEGVNTYIGNRFGTIDFDYVF